jgi:hypothetical protein
MVKAFVLAKVGNKKVKIFIKDIFKMTVVSKRQIPDIPDHWKNSTDSNSTEVELPKSDPFQ